MTPIRSMKPSLTYTSTSSLTHPVTPAQWQMTLQYIKFIYFKGRLKQCAAQCKLLLQSSASASKSTSNPLHATYLQFYLALSTEGVARLIHNLSSSKVDMLVQARASYEAAASSLPSLETAAETEDSMDQGEWSEHETASPILYTPSEGPSTPSPTFSNFYSPVPSSPSSLYSKNSLDDKFDDTARRHALHICTNIPYLPPPQKHKPMTSTPKTPPPKEKQPPELQNPSQSSPSPATNAFATSTKSWLQIRAQNRFNTNLLAFSEMLSNHICAIDSLLTTAREAQANRYNTTNKVQQARITAFPGYGVDEALDLKIRIHRLKENGWKIGRGFEPERYQRLCERALADL